MKGRTGTDSTGEFVRFSVTPLVRKEHFHAPRRPEGRKRLVRNKVGTSARMSDCERRLKLAANGF